MRPFDTVVPTYSGGAEANLSPADALKRALAWQAPSFGKLRMIGFTDKGEPVTP